MSRDWDAYVLADVELGRALQRLYSARDTAARVALDQHRRPSVRRAARLERVVAALVDVETYVRRVRRQCAYHYRLHCLRNPDE